MTLIGEDDLFGVRRLKLLRVNLEVLSYLLKADGSLVPRTEGVPADARVVGAHYRPEAHELVLVLESDKFGPAKVGYHLAEVNATITFDSLNDAVTAKIQATLEGMKCR